MKGKKPQMPNDNDDAHHLIWFCLISSAVSQMEAEVSQLET